MNPLQAPVAAAPSVSILMYHQVGRFPEPTAHRAVFCDVGRFRRQMAWLKWTGWNVIGLEQAYLGLFAGAPLPTKAVVLTFDDGYENFREHAWPILREHGFPASVFLVSRLVGRGAEWLHDLDQAPLMNAASVRELRREGCHFGSHTLSHPKLATLDTAQQKREIVDSKAELEDLLGEPVPDLCYPYGNYDRRARDHAIEAGYRLGLTCLRGAANTADNAFEIPRKGISYGDNLVGYWWKVAHKHERKGVPGTAAYS